MLTLTREAGVGASSDEWMRIRAWAEQQQVPVLTCTYSQRHEPSTINTHTLVHGSWLSTYSSISRRPETGPLPKRLLKFPSGLMKHSDPSQQQKTNPFCLTAEPFSRAVLVTTNESRLSSSKASVSPQTSIKAGVYSGFHGLSGKSTLCIASRLPRCSGGALHKFLSPWLVNLNYSEALLISGPVGREYMHKTIRGSRYTRLREC